MTKNISQITVLSLLVTALVALPALSRAEGPDAKPPGASEHSPDGKPDKPGKSNKHGVPFNGKLAAADAQAMTFTVGTMVIHVTADTKVTRNGQPATLADGVVGEPVSGAYQKAEDGQLNATVLHLGGKHKDKPENKHQEPPAAGDKQ
jgi:hypothetical protein